MRRSSFRQALARWALRLSLAAAGLTISPDAYAICGKQSCIPAPTFREPPDFHSSPQPTPQPSPQDLARRHANELNEQGVTLYQQGDLAAAVVKFQQALALDPSNRFIAGNMNGTEAKIAWQAGQLQVALKLAKAALSYNDHPTWRTLVADIKQAYLVHIDSRLAAISRQERTYAVQLVSLKSQYKSQIADFGAWAKEADRGLQDAEKQFADIVISETLAKIFETSDAMEGEHIKDMIAHAHGVTDVRKINATEIKQLVDGVRDEIRAAVKGVPDLADRQAIAKQIVLQTIRKTGRDVKAASQFAEQFTEMIDKKILLDPDKADETSLQTVADQTYPWLITLLNVGKDYGWKVVKGTGRSFSLVAFAAKHTDVLALAPNMINIAASLYDLSHETQIIDGLDRLQAVTNQQRSDVSRGLKRLIEERRELLKQKQLLLTT